MNLSSKPEHIDVCGVTYDHVDVIGTVGPSQIDRVTEKSGIQIDQIHRCPCQVVDRNAICTAQGVHVESLDICHIDRSGRWSCPGQDDPTAGSRDSDRIGCRAAVECLDVLAGTAVDRVGSVPIVPDKTVGTVAAGELIVTESTGDQVVASSTADGIVAIVAGDVVLTRSTRE